MPKGDRTGPAGMGPMSGRGFGYCAGYAMPGYAGRGPVRGAEWFSGFFRYGRGNCSRFHRPGFFGRQSVGAYDYYAPASGPIPSKEMEIQALKDELQDYERVTQQLRSRLTELEKNP